VGVERDRDPGDESL
jgi:hypothetical protein